MEIVIPAVKEILLQNVDDYDDPDDFAGEWEDEFDDGYDEAYDYWEEEHE